MLIISDRASWAVDEVAREMQIHTGAKVSSLRNSVLRPFASDRFFMTPDLFLLAQDKFARSLKLRTGYFNFFHGLPTNDTKYQKRLDALERYKEYVLGVRTTTIEATNFLLERQVSENIVRVPLGVELDNHGIASDENRSAFRERYQIPSNAILIGSFQKDGQGWGNGLDPKLEKGPDVFVETLRWLKNQGANVHALLTGPSRGYLLNGLESASVPYTYFGNVALPRVNELYALIDVYLVSSRFEGGPRALLATLASGRPIVTTRVGMAPDILEQTPFSRVVESWEPADLGTCLLDVMSGWSQSYGSLARSKAEEHTNLRYLPELRKLMSSESS